jgi:beta-hydroxylase
MPIAIGLFAIFAFVAGSLTYVYKIRGRARYENFSEYVRKGWPIFTPLNCVLYLFTQRRARKPIMELKDFPELKELTENWEDIRNEALGLYEKGFFDQIKDPSSKSFYDIGFRTFYKYGWSKFYLNWYGYTHESSRNHCPKTVELLERAPLVNGAMFSILPVGSKLTRHLDPVACSLRYHLGLSTPESRKCFINVDGESYSWKNGEAFMFDETYIHYARNESDKPRIILMCDIDRPTHTLGTLINSVFKVLMRATVVPNTSEDKQGLVNTIFSSLGPVLKKTKALKETNLALYKVIKHSVNFALLLVVIGLAAGLVNLGTSLAQMVFG